MKKRVHGEDEDDSAGDEEDRTVVSNSMYATVATLNLVIRKLFAKAVGKMKQLKKKRITLDFLRWAYTNDEDLSGKGGLCSAIGIEFEKLHRIGKRRIALPVVEPKGPVEHDVDDLEDAEAIGGEEPAATKKKTKKAKAAKADEVDEKAPPAKKARKAKAAKADEVDEEAPPAKKARKAKAAKADEVDEEAPPAKKARKAKATKADEADEEAPPAKKTRKAKAAKADEVDEEAPPAKKARTKTAHKVQAVMGEDDEEPSGDDDDDDKEDE